MSAGASAEGLLDEAGFEGLREYALSETGFDAGQFIEGLLNGDFIYTVETLKTAMGSAIDNVRNEIASLAVELMPIVLISVALKVFLGARPATSVMADLTCTLACGWTLYRRFMTAHEVTEALLSRLGEAVHTLAPVLTACAALTGASATASLMAPLSAEGADLMEWMLKDLGLRLCAAMGAVALAGSLSRRLPLYHLFGLMRSAVRWLLGACVLLVSALAAVQGGMSAARDTATIRVARTAVENLVPVIGGGVSDSVGALTVSAGVLRQAVGLTGVAVIVCTCAAPLLSLAAGMLSVRLSAALLEPMCEAPVIALIGRYGQLMELLLAMGVGAVLIAALLSGGLLACVG